jgi:hypothetical protein
MQAGGRGKLLAMINHGSACWTDHTQRETIAECSGYTNSGEL